jgi:biotin transport system substrate-specific component
MVVGSLLVYAIGVPWLKTMLGMSYGKALAVGMYPFVIGDALKIVAALAIVKSVRPLLRTGQGRQQHQAPLRAAK